MPCPRHPSAGGYEVDRTQRLQGDEALRRHCRRHQGECNE